MPKKNAVKPAAQSEVQREDPSREEATEQATNAIRAEHSVPRGPETAAAALSPSSKEALVALIRYSASSLEADVAGEAAGVFTDRFDYAERVLRALIKRALEEQDAAAKQILLDFLNAALEAVRSGGGGGEDPVDLLQGGGS